MIPGPKPTAQRDLRTTGGGETALVTVKPWWASKTLWLNVVAFLIAMVGVLMGPDFAEILPKDWGKYLLAVVAVLNMLLRMLSNQPLDGGGGGSPNTGTVRV